MKIDCIQHIGKCFRNKLDNPATKGEKISDGKSIYQGKHRLGPDTRKKLQTYFNNAVRNKIRPGILSQQQLDEAVVKMKTAILATLYHCLNIQNYAIRHQYCPTDSWCSFKSANNKEKRENITLMVAFRIFWSRFMNSTQLAKCCNA